jgi:flagellar biosynthesis/type III secretory pathway M-ring protein FliF/YscJ
MRKIKRWIYLVSIAAVTGIIAFVLLYMGGLTV